MPVLEEGLTSRLHCFAKIAKNIREKKYGLLAKLGFRFHRLISETFKVSLQTFAIERSLCESCGSLVKGIDKSRVILERPSKKTPPF